MRAECGIPGLQECQGDEIRQEGDSREVASLGMEPVVSMGPISNLQQITAWPQNSVASQMEPAGHAASWPGNVLTWCGGRQGMEAGNGAAVNSTALGAYQYPQCYANQSAGYYAYPTWPMLQQQFLSATPTIWPTWDPRNVWTPQPVPSISGGPQMTIFHNGAPHWGTSGHVPSGSMIHAPTEAGGMHTEDYPVQSSEAPGISSWNEEVAAEVPGGNDRSEEIRSAGEEEKAWLAKLRPPDGCPWIEQQQNNAQEIERGKSLERWRQWLLFLRHCAHCSGSCVLKEGCSAGKALWRHILTCQNAACAYASCRRTRAVLTHQKSCKSATCTLCRQVLVAPVPSPQELQAYLPNFLISSNDFSENTGLQLPLNRNEGGKGAPTDLLTGMLGETKPFVRQMSGGGLEDIDMDFCEGSEDGEVVENDECEGMDLTQAKEDVSHRKVLRHDRMGEGETNRVQVPERSSKSEKFVLRGTSDDGDLDSAFKDKAICNQNVTFKSSEKDKKPANGQNLVIQQKREGPYQEHAKEHGCRDMGTQANQLAPKVEIQQLVRITTSGDAEKTTFHQWSMEREDQRATLVSESGVGTPAGQHHPTAHPSEKPTEFDCGNVGTTAVEKTKEKLPGSGVLPKLVSVQVQTDNRAHSSETPACLSIFDSRESKMGGTQNTNGSQTLEPPGRREASSSEKGGFPVSNRRARRQRPSSPAKSSFDESTTPHGGKKTSKKFWQDPYKYSMPSECENVEQGRSVRANPESFSVMRKTDSSSLNERGGVTDVKNLKPLKLVRSPLSRDQALNRAQIAQSKEIIPTQRKDARGKKRNIGTDAFGLGARKIYVKSNPKGNSTSEGQYLAEKNAGTFGDCRLQPASKQQASKASSSAVALPNSQMVGSRPSTWRKPIARDLPQGVPPGAYGRPQQSEDGRQKKGKIGSLKKLSQTSSISLSKSSEQGKKLQNGAKAKGLFASLEAPKRLRAKSASVSRQEGPSLSMPIKVKLRVSEMTETASRKRGSNQILSPPLQQEKRTSDAQVPLSLCGCLQPHELESHIGAVRREMGENLQKVVPGVGRVGEETCVVCRHQSLKYSPKAKKHRIAEEPWVQCDGCQGWVHQICSLFNSRLNSTGVHYLCPICQHAQLKANEGVTQVLRPIDMDAKNLPACQLSKHLESRLRSALKREWKARCAQNPGEEIARAGELTVRVVYSKVRECQAGQNFQNAFKDQRAMKFPYRQRVIMLFQKIHGADVLLFCLYAQEYGPDAPNPNKGWVYLAYVDSIKYFQPNVTAGNSNVPLRTLVYHELLLGYMAFVRYFGYHSMFIWACPPGGKDNDYIMNCHPPSQKIPTEGRLRRWYLDLLECARAEGLVTEQSNMSEVLQGKEGAFTSALEIPYFDGDYWPEETEKLLEGMQNKLKSRGGGALGSRDNADKELMSMLRGSQSISAWQNFLLARFQQRCGICRKFIPAGHAWACHPPKPSAATPLSSLRRSSDGLPRREDGAFVLCPNCHEAESNSVDGEHPKIPSGHMLENFTREVYKPQPLANVPDDENIPCSFLETRDLFLRVCQWNHYEFDSLRKAKHSSLMVLHHLMNPKVPVLPATCQVCYGQLEGQKNWQCTMCLNVNFCKSCYERGLRHVHDLELVGPNNNASSDGVGLGKTIEPQQEDEPKQGPCGKRVPSVTNGEGQNIARIEKATQLLIHAQTCKDADCQIRDCQKAQKLLNHVRSGCRNHDCPKCYRFRRFLKEHTRLCKGLGCALEHCSQSSLFKGKRIADDTILTHPAKRQRSNQ